MNIIFKPIDWYHCGIYKKRRFLGEKLIGIAKLDDNGWVITRSNQRLSAVIALNAGLYILYNRYK